VMEQISYKFKFKKDKIEQPESYLGAGVKRKVLDGQHMWTMSSYDYVTAAVKNVKATLKDNQRWNLPKKAVTPMNSDYTPELDGSSELNAHDHTYFQELIGVLRWATEIGRVDILLEVSLLSQYQAGPREGHMEQLLRIFAYLDQHPKMTLYFDWRIPNADFSGVKSSYKEFRTLYRDAEEQLPSNMPKPGGRRVGSLAYVDALHAANKKTCRSHTGYVIFLNRALLGLNSLL
ncbi:unnamed protein product, partial [Cylindrotheca closterium]